LIEIAKTNLRLDMPIRQFEVSSKIAFDEPTRRLEAIDIAHGWTDLVVGMTISDATIEDHVIVYSCNRVRTSEPSATSDATQADCGLLRSPIALDQNPHHEGRCESVVYTHI